MVACRSSHLDGRNNGHKIHEILDLVGKHTREMHYNILDKLNI